MLQNWGCGNPVSYLKMPQNIWMKGAQSFAPGADCWASTSTASDGLSLGTTHAAEWAHTACSRRGGMIDKCFPSPLGYRQWASLAAGWGSRNAGRWAGSLQSVQVKAGDAKPTAPAVLAHAAPVASKPHEEEGTRMNCDQAGFVQKAGPGWGVHEGEIPESGTNKPIPLGRAFSSNAHITSPSSPSLFAISKLQRPTHNGFLSGQVSCPRWQEKDKLVGNFVPPPTHFQPGFSTWLDPRSRESCQVPAETLAVGLKSQTLCML